MLIVTIEVAILEYYRYTSKLLIIKGCCLLIRSRIESTTVSLTDRIHSLFYSYRLDIGKSDCYLKSGKFDCLSAPNNYSLSA
jgi:hypothetical protein